MPLWFYRYSGLEITSELHLPEWSVFEKSRPSAAPDLQILCSATDASEGQNAAALVTTAEEYQFFVADAATYRVSRVGKINICTVPSPDMRKVRVFLLGAAWAAFCVQRGLLLLHASAVQVGQEAVAFCGPSGAGKSSMAAWLTTLGCSLVSDDLCRFSVSSTEPPTLYPSATRLKLWREALSSLAMDSSAKEQDHARMDKYHVPLNISAQPERLPVTAICLLAWGEKPARTRLSGTMALRRLVGDGTYRGDILGATGGLADHWSLCAELVRRVPVWELARPRDWSQMEAVTSLALDGKKEPTDEH